MKRVIAILCIALLTLSTASAQITFGARAGLNMANISLPSKDMDMMGGEFKSHMGLNLGLVAEMAMKSFFIQAGLVYDGVGTKYTAKSDQVGYNFEEEVKASGRFLSIPILAKYVMPLSNDLGLYGLAGPYLAFLLGGTAKAEIKADNYTDSFEEDVKDHAKSTDYGLVIGVGVQKPMGERTLFVDLRYRMGLSNDASDSGFVQDMDVKCKIFSINVGVLGLI